jgi:hypothetical protein
MLSRCANCPIRNVGIDYVGFSLYEICVFLLLLICLLFFFCPDIFIWSFSVWAYPYHNSVKTAYIINAKAKYFFSPIFRIETLLNIAIMSYLRPFSLQPKDLRLSALDCWLQHVFRLMRDSQVLAMRVPPRSPSFNDQYLDFQVTSFIIKSSSWIVQIHFYGDLHRINLLRYD